MSETCIVCLGDFGENANDFSQALAQNVRSQPHDDRSQTVPTMSAPPFHSSEIDNALIAHLLPCGHNLHDECLKPWVERANSCPICRQSFNEVELVTSVGGNIISSYAVTDRTQVADVDPTMIVDEYYEEPEDRPCPVCREDDNEDILLACDGCDAYYHTYCIGMDEVPAGHWFCEDCETQRAVESVCPTAAERHPQRAHNARGRRTRGQQRRVRNRNEASSSNWARVWQSVWDNLNLDLDFPFDEDPNGAQIGRAQRASSSDRDFRQWERRLHVAERQGAGNRFRDTASALLDLHAPREQPPQADPESREEIIAWNAFEKAKEIEAHPSPKRKRKSATMSPSDAEPIAQPDRPLKRPRTRRVVENGAVVFDPPSESRRSSTAGPSSSRVATASASSTQAAGPSFLQSMLREIETSNTPDECARPGRLSILPNMTQSSPRPPSPAASPTTSDPASPSARSLTPPPSISPRPNSPLSLTSKVEPLFPPPEFSPNRSPPDGPLAHRSKAETKRQARPLQQSSSPQRSADSSPNRVPMPFSTKADLQRMVSSALKPHYQSNVVSKDQYTVINRNISRMLYDKVGEAGYVNREEREAYERLATEAVAKAIHGLETST